MPTAMKTRIVRRSISLRADLDRKIQHLATHTNRSTNRVLAELIEVGLESKEAEKQRFFALADRLAVTSDKREQQRLKEELARLTFGE